MEFLLPDVGEGLTEAELVTWAVKPGDAVHLNQVICEIETAKSLVELPSPFEGTVTELLVETGTTVPVGTPIMRVSAEGEPDNVAPDEVVPDVELPAADVPAADVPAGATTAETPATETDDDSSGAVLVGYGTGGPVKSRRQKGGQPLLTAVKPTAAEPAQPGRVYAKPPVRKLAKDRGVELTAIAGTGRGGEILRDDVLGKNAGISAPRAVASFSGEREERIPVKGIRKLVAESMVASKFSAPHTSVYVDVDATRTMEYVSRLKQSSDFEGVRVSPLLIMSKAIIWALGRNPEINSAWAGTEIIRRNYVNLGIAAATPRGLVVPNIKDAQNLSLRELAAELETLTSRAREGLTQPAESEHGTITITNVGVFGVDFGLPILNPGETAIMALGSIKLKPWVVDGEVRPRMVTTVGGSFDHRVVDGDVICAFVADVASILEEPALLLD